MTIYTFKPTFPTQLYNWDDPTIWEGGVVPNDLAANVTFPLVTTVGTGMPYSSFITIKTGESFQTHSIQLDSSDYLSINGSLNVATDFNAGGELDFSGGTLTAGSLETNGSDVQGQGQVNAGSVVNNTRIVGGISVQADSFHNNGSLIAISGNQTISVTPGGFANLSGTTLTGGAYEADSYSGTSYILSLNVGGVIATDAASITLGGGTIQSFDSTTGQYVALTSSLHTVAPSGVLTLQDASYAFGPLSVAGTLALAGTTSPPVLTSSQLTITKGGTLNGGGTVSGPIDNEGLIESTSFSPLVLNGPVTGNGSLEIAAGSIVIQGKFVEITSYELVLNSATSQTVTFQNNLGELALATPLTLTGKIAPGQTAGDQILLESLSSQSITGLSYKGNSQGGTLTLHAAGGPISLNFIGDYNASSFSYAPGPQQLSSDPPSTLITIGNPVCFVAGTLIRTVRGDIAVEHLAVGDVVVTTAGVERPIRWLGRRAFDCRAYRDAFDVMPVRIAKDAFGTHRPARDLLVSPGHAICVSVLDEILVPAAALVNGTTVAPVEVDAVTYWHVELDGHDIILANGLPTESYIDVGNRAFFSDSGAGIDADAPAASLADYCRPLHAAGPLVEAVRERLRARANAFGWGRDAPTTSGLRSGAG